MEVEFSIHQAKNIPEKYSNAVFAEYQWIDDRATLFETDRVKSRKKDRNPLFNYKRVHDILIDNYIVENLSETTCIVSVYGKLTEENMEGLYKDFSIRPETAQLINPKEVANLSDPFYNAAFGKSGNQNVMILEDENESKNDSIEKSKKRNADKEKDRQKALKEKEKELEKLKKELEKYNQQNEKLKNDITLIGKGGKGAS